MLSRLLDVLEPPDPADVPKDLQARLERGTSKGYAALDGDDCAFLLSLLKAATESQALLKRILAPEMGQCSRCKGTGEDDEGSTCFPCHGSGEVPEHD